jgi:SAM-dependent methyltransferase
LHFANSYFDAIICIDSYYYYGTGDSYLDTHIAPLLKDGGILAVSVPGLFREFGTNVPDEMKPFFAEEDDRILHDTNWWKRLWGNSNSIELIDAFSHKCHTAAWEDWLACDNPHAKKIVPMMEAAAGKYFDTIGLIAQKLRK